MRQQLAKVQSEQQSATAEYQRLQRRNELRKEVGVGVLWWWGNSSKSWGCGVGVTVARRRGHVGAVPELAAATMPRTWSIG